MIIIRDAVCEDAQRICEINKLSFGYDYPQEKTEARIKYILSRNTDKLFVACDDNKVIGYIHGCDYECTYSDSMKDIMAIAIEEQCRGKGVGRLLIETLENWAIQDGSIGVRLVSGMNREKAHEFYLHCGYSLRKVQKNFIKIL